MSVELKRDICSRLARSCQSVGVATPTSAKDSFLKNIQMKMLETESFFAPRSWREPTSNQELTVGLKREGFKCKEDITSIEAPAHGNLLFVR